MDAYCTWTDSCDLGRSWGKGTLERAKREGQGEKAYMKAVSGRIRILVNVVNPKNRTQSKESFSIEGIVLNPRHRFICRIVGNLYQNLRIFSGVF